MNYQLIETLRKEKPLVHHITNTVTINECANITLCFGALPVMANAREEVVEMVEHSKALVLNIGTLTKEQIEAMIIAGKKANELKIPIVLDPVGVGATTMRTISAINLLKEIKPTVIKGNAAEISILSGQEGQIKGVESLGEYKDINDTAISLANSYNCVVVVSGREDIVTDGKTTFLITNGHQLLGQVVGTGCMAASVIGSFLGAQKETLKTVVEALVSYEVAGELAAERSDVKGPGTFKQALFDEVISLGSEIINKKAKIKRI